MGETPPASPPPVPVETAGLPAALPEAGLAQVVTADSPCRKCGYNLRGLRGDGRCPECGTPVGVSILGNLLRFSDPAWLRVVARGMGLTLVGIYGQIIFGFLGGALVGMRVPSGLALATVGVVATNLLVLIGTWQFTTPDPSGIGEDRYGTIRKIVRVTLAIGIINALTTNLPQLITVPQTVHGLIALLGLIVGLSAVVGLWAQLTYLMSLGERLPDSKIVSSLRQVRSWLVPIDAILFLSTGIVEMGQIMGKGLAPTGGPMIGIGCFAGIIGLVSLAFYVRFLIAIHRFRRELRGQAAFADQVWAATAGSSPR